MDKTKIAQEVKDALVDWIKNGCPNMDPFLASTMSGICTKDVYLINDSWVTFEFDGGFPVIYAHHHKRYHFIVPVFSTELELAFSKVVEDITNILIEAE